MTDWASVEQGVNIPKNALRGGHDTYGYLYVARGNLKGDLIPGKYAPALEKFYVAWNELEHVVSDFKVLTLNTHDGYMASWIDVGPDDRIPTGAYVAGKTSDGDPLFVGRKYVFNGYHIGKVSLSQKKCFIPYDGKEHAFDKFEVLIISRQIKNHSETPSEDKKIEKNIIKYT